MKWIIDRFEGDYAVVGCGDVYFNIPKSVLPFGALEGDVLDVEINVADTNAKTIGAKDRLKKLFGE